MASPPLYRDADFVVFVVTVLAVLLTFSFCAFIKGVFVIESGPPVAVSETAKSLWAHGSLSPPYFAELQRRGPRPTAERHRLTSGRMPTHVAAMAS